MLTIEHEHIVLLIMLIMINFNFIALNGFLSKKFYYFTEIFSLYSLLGRKSVDLAIVKLCTSCSQKADRRASSLKSERKFHFHLGGKISIFLTGLNGLYLLMQTH